jgi:CRISPR-associated protein Csd2
MSTDKSLANRYDFVLVFDVKDGNPNGDPDAGNMPRLDAESGHGLVTDVSLKRKVRNFVGLAKEQDERAPVDGEKRFEIYVREKAILNHQHQRAYSALNLDCSARGTGGRSYRKHSNRCQKEKACQRQTQRQRRRGKPRPASGCARTSLTCALSARSCPQGVNCGQVRGPVQLTFARSVEPIVALEHSITRMAVATEAEAEKQQGDNRTMGRKHTVPYGVYVAHGFVSSFLAKQTGFGEDDLELVFQALSQMFEHDRSAARGEMSTRGLYVFKHDSELGNAPAHALFDRLQVTPKEEGAVARSFDAYSVAFDGQSLAVGQSSSPHRA